MAGHPKRGGSGFHDAHCTVGYALNAPWTIEYTQALPKTEPMHYISLAPFAPQ